MLVSSIIKGIVLVFFLVVLMALVIAAIFIDQPNPNAEKYNLLMGIRQTFKSSIYIKDKLTGNCFLCNRNKVENYNIIIIPIPCETIPKDLLLDFDTQTGKGFEKVQ